MKSHSHASRRKDPNNSVKRENIRHSSPILGAIGKSSRDYYLEPLKSGNEGEKSVRPSSMNQTSNTSDISMPGQSLHTDSGISSSDSLAGCDKRSSSPVDHDFVSELMKIADNKLAELAVREDSWDDQKVANFSREDFKSLSTRDNILLPVLGNNDAAASTSSIFMTAIDSDVPMPDDDFDVSLSGDRIRKYNAPFSSNTNEIRQDDARFYCSACGEVLNDPRILPCLHTFCLECLHSLVNQNDDTCSSVQGEHEQELYISDSLHCPTCSTKVNLSVEGVYSLPVNYLIQRLLVINNLRSSKEKERSCDLCPDNSSTEGMCIQCEVNLCHFCFQAHKRQSLTSAHTVLSAEEVAQLNNGAASSSSIKSLKRSVPIMCQRHTEEELKLYCLDCSQLVCRDCCLGAKHRDHKCEYVNYVVDRKVSEIGNEFRNCEPKIQSLRQTIAKLDHSEKVIKDAAEEVSEKVERHIASYIASIEKHRNTLLGSIKQKTKLKQESLQKQKKKLNIMLRDLSHSCEFASHVLDLGTQHEILSMKPFLIDRLQELAKLQFSEKPCPVDDFIEFKANKKVKTWIEGDMVSCLAENKRSSKLLRPGLEVDICGDVVSRALEPKNCTAHGDGIHCSRVKLPSEFIILAKSFEHEKLEHGGHDVDVSLAMEGVDSNLFKKPKVQVTDKQDGTYRVLYIIYATGNYKLEVRAYGEHIRGSPFHVSAIDSKADVHSGIFHCCCFCSSGGDKNAVCACKAKMPGYRGCGHGHEGHPGSAHWSCCGKLTESSSCSKPVIRPLPLNSEEAFSSMPKPTVDHRSQTLPARRSIAREYQRQPSCEEDMYSTSSTLRTQRGPFYPRQHFSRQQSAPNPPAKQVKTVTL